MYRSHGDSLESFDSKSAELVFLHQEDVSQASCCFENMMFA